MEITIRKMELEDLSQVVRIATQAFLERARFTSRFGVGVIERLQELPDWQHVAVARSEIVGFMTCSIHKEKEYTGIGWIAVHPAWQGMGVGRKLMDALETRSREEGFQKVVTGTPYALDFYIRCGYRATGATYRMIKELPGRCIEAPEGVRIRIIDLEDLTDLMETLEEGSQRLRFAKSFMQVYEREQDKSFCIEEGGEVKGILVGETNPYNYELVRALFVSYSDVASLRNLLDAFAYLCSKKGKRWAGFETKTVGLKETIEAWGWEEAHLPSWFVSYEVEKDLT